MAHRSRPLLRCLFTLLAPLWLFFEAQAQQVADGPPSQDPFRHRPAPEVPGGRYLSHLYTDGVLTIRATDGSTRQVQPWATGVVKISYFAPGRQPVADSSVSVVQPAEAYNPAQPATAGTSLNEWEARLFGRKWRQSVAWGELHTPPLLRKEAVVATASSVQLLYAKSLLTIDKKSLTISLTRRDYYRPYLLFSEAAPAYRRQPTTPPGPDTPPSRIDELAGTGVRFRLQPGERLYGTGSRALPLDRRGYRLELYNQAHYGYGNGEPALNVTLPVVLSSRGYLLLFDHYAAGYLDMGKKNPDALEYGAEGLNSLSYFVVAGRNQAEILDRYTALTGRQPLPPRWALGLIQSRFGYRSQAEMLHVANQMHRNNFPLDALVLDLYWFGGTTRQGDFRWDAANFPDPTGMMRDLKAQGVNTILISEPYVMRTSRNDSLVRTLGLVGTTARRQPYTVGSFWAGPASILDVFKPETRTWLWAQYQRLHDQGAAGWWSDLGEPENHPDAMYHRLGKGRLPARQVHNAYGLTWASIFQDNYARSYPNERLFNLARSGWAGMQRHSVFPWSGDVSRTWSGLQAQVPIMLSMGQVGVGYMHSDAGGFGANAMQDPELYTRWLQMAALGPILRPHSDQVVAPEPYTYPEPYKSIVRDYAHLRATLLPYLYTLAAENTLTGAPLVRALDYYAYGAHSFRTIPITALDQLSDSASITKPYYQWSQLPRRISKSLFLPRTTEERYGATPPNDQFLLGSELLVAPVNQPGQRRRNVVLPKSVGGWLDFETGQLLPDSQLVGLPAPLGHVPLLVRAGAVVPVAAYRASTAAFRPDTLGLRYFPVAGAGNRHFTVYEDDGHSARALTQRQFVTFLLKTGDGGGSWDKNSAIGSLTVHKRGGYPGQPTARFVRLEVMRVAARPAGVLLNERPLANAAWRFDSTRHILSLLAPLASSVTISFPSLQLLAQPAAQLDPETLTLTAPDSRTFTNEAAIHYTRYTVVSQPEMMSIRDQRGRVVRELPTLAAPGPHTVTWDGRDTLGRSMPAGLYVAEVAGQHQVLRRLAE